MPLALMLEVIKEDVPKLKESKEELGEYNPSSRYDPVAEMWNFKEVKEVAQFGSSS
jgi:hypothetical protein